MRMMPLPRRAGLTLVEMLVALALTVFMMSILSEAFVTGLDTMSKMKALSDLEQQLRDVGAILKRDLQANHFEGHRRLSELTAGGQPLPKNVVHDPADPLFLRYRLQAPELGYFYVREEPIDAPGTFRVFEGYDQQNRPLDRDVGDEIAFTARLTGRDRNNIFDGFVATNDRLGQALDANFLGSVNFDGSATDNRFMSQWAEVAYWLRQQDGQPLNSVYTLFRRQLLLVPEAQPVDAATGGFLPNIAPWSFPAGATFHNQPLIPPISGSVGERGRVFFSFFDISAWYDAANNVGFINSPADVQHPQRRFYNQPQNRTNNPPAQFVHGRLWHLAAPREGADILLNNVINFDVKVWDPVALVRAGSSPPIYRGAWVDVRFNPAEAPYNVNPMIDGVSHVWNSDSPWAEGPSASTPVLNSRFFDTGTNRDGSPGFGPEPAWPRQGPGAAPTFGPFPIPAIQITIRAFEPKSNQTRQITIIVDM